MIRSNFLYSWDLSPSRHRPDVKIYTSDCDSSSQVEAHRAVLASHSNLLKTVFLSSDVEAVIILPDFTKQDLELMLQLLYGQVAEVSSPSDIFSVLGLCQVNPKIERVVDVNQSEIDMFDKAVNSDKGISEKSLNGNFGYNSKVHTDSHNNLVVEAVGHVKAGTAIDVDLYMHKDPSNLRPWLCQLCLAAGAYHPYRAMQRHNLKYHIIRKHFKMDVAKNWQCDLCDRKFISRSGLRQHKRDTCPKSTQMPVKPLQTMPNANIMPSGSHFKMEPQNVNESSNQMFQCANCFIIFDNFENVEKHLQVCGGGLKEEGDW